MGYQLLQTQVDRIPAIESPRVAESASFHVATIPEAEMLQDLGTRWSLHVVENAQTLWQQAADASVPFRFLALVNATSTGYYLVDRKLQTIETWLRERERHKPIIRPQWPQQPASYRWVDVDTYLPQRYRNHPWDRDRSYGYELSTLVVLMVHVRVLNPGDKVHARFVLDFVLKRTDAFWYQYTRQLEDDWKRRLTQQARGALEIKRDTQAKASAVFVSVPPAGPVVEKQIWSLSRKEQAQAPIPTQKAWQEALKRLDQLEQEWSQQWVAKEQAQIVYEMQHQGLKQRWKQAMDGWSALQERQSFTWRASEKELGQPRRIHILAFHYRYDATQQEKPHMFELQIRSGMSFSDQEALMQVVQDKLSQLLCDDMKHCQVEWQYLKL
jgi:hypothetical protein